jgi:hypothetical protein
MDRQSNDFNRANFLKTCSKNSIQINFQRNNTLNIKFHGALCVLKYLKLTQKNNIMSKVVQGIIKQNLPKIALACFEKNLPLYNSQFCHLGQRQEKLLISVLSRENKFDFRTRASARAKFLIGCDFPTNANRIEKFVVSLGSSKPLSFFSEILVVPIF